MVPTANSLLKRVSIKPTRKVDLVFYRFWKKAVQKKEKRPSFHLASTSLPQAQEASRKEFSFFSELSHLFQRPKEIYQGFGSTEKKLKK